MIEYQSNKHVYWSKNWIFYIDFEHLIIVSTISILQFRVDKLP